MSSATLEDRQEVAPQAKILTDSAAPQTWGDYRRIMEALLSDPQIPDTAQKLGASRRGQNALADTMSRLTPHYQTRERHGYQEVLPSHVQTDVRKLVHMMTTGQLPPRNWRKILSLGML